MTNIDEPAMSETIPFRKGRRVTVAQFNEQGFTEAPGINDHVGTQVSYRNSKIVIGAPIVSFANENKDIICQSIALKDPLEGQYEIIGYRFRSSQTD